MSGSVLILSDFVLFSSNQLDVSDWNFIVVPFFQITSEVVDASRAVLTHSNVISLNVAGAKSHFNIFGSDNLPFPKSKVNEVSKEVSALFSHLSRRHFVTYSQYCTVKIVLCI